MPTPLWWVSPCMRKTRWGLLAMTPGSYTGKAAELARRV
jgi:hypothetical protein